jgi:membrane protease YdiL (CAAX protease family)
LGETRAQHAYEEEVDVQTTEFHPDSIPWTVRDVWMGVLVLGPWWVVFITGAILLQSLDLNVNPGLVIALGELLMLLPVWWLGVRKYRVGWGALGLRAFRGQALGVGCGLMLISFLFNAFYSVLLAFFDLEVQADLAPVFAELSSPWWLLLAGVVVAPLVEEVFFRGFLFAGLRKRYEWQTAALISSALFALIHLQLTSVLPIFLLGYIFAYLYHRSNSIWPAILMHVTTNGLALGTAYLLANTELPT